MIHRMHSVTLLDILTRTSRKHRDFSNSLAVIEEIRARCHSSDRARNERMNPSRERMHDGCVIPSLLRMFLHASYDTVHPMRGHPEPAGLRGGKALEVPEVWA